MTWQEELALWEERFRERTWQIAVRLRDAAIALNRVGEAGGVSLPEVTEKDDSGDAVAFKWEQPAGYFRQPEFAWVEVYVARSDSGEGYNLVVSATTTLGELFLHVPDNFTSKCWKTSYEELEETAKDVMDRASEIAYAIRTRAREGKYAQG